MPCNAGLRLNEKKKKEKKNEYYYVESLKTCLVVNLYFHYRRQQCNFGDRGLQPLTTDRRLGTQDAAVRT